MATFVPSKDYLSNMENRRCDFYGLQLFGAAAYMTEDPGNYSNFVQFFPNNDTYDITKLANNTNTKMRGCNIAPQSSTCPWPLLVL